MSAYLRSTSLLFMSLVISACDPSSLNTESSTLGAANSSSSNTAYEILSADNTSGRIDTASIITTRGIGNGLYDDPVVLNPDEPFEVYWKTSLEAVSLISLELYSPENPDAGSSGFSSFTNCNDGGNCIENSVVCDYSVNTLTDSLSGMDCPFTHPDTGEETLNFLDFSYIDSVDTSAQSAVYELRVKLCALADLTNCDLSRIAYVEMNK